MNNVGINTRTKKKTRFKDTPVIEVKLEQELEQCMKCKFFYGNNHQCILKKCVKESAIKELEVSDESHICYQCPYKKSEGYCFPCMKKLLGKKTTSEKEEEKKWTTILK